jgi:hypothetical protein
MNKLTVALLAATLIPTQAIAAQQFDLVCSGAYARIAAPFIPHFVVDLNTMEWCDQNVCRKVREVTPSTITFRDGHSDQGDGGIEYVDRQTGELIWINDGTSKAICTPAPFSGFKAAKF